MFSQLQRLVILWKNKKKFYESPIQKILDQWDKQHQPSISQEKERARHQKIQYQRDHRSEKNNASNDWLSQNDIQ